MIRERENYHAFLLHFLERLNSCDSIEKKITESLTDICEYYGFKRAFIYQTDGFRYFYLKETIGNNDNILRQRFEISEMSNQHIAHANGKSKPFYACRTQNASWDDVDIIDFYRVDSLLIRQIQDSEGKIIGFIGFADREHAISFIDEELQMIHLILGSLSKEIAVREYKEREVRAGKTLSSIMNNMGVDIYVNSFDSHDMLYANESMAAPYGGIEHFEGKKCWQALYKDKTGECEFCPKKHLIDENGQPTKVYSWDYQRPFDKCWFRVFSAAFAWIDGQIAHVITSVDIDHQKIIEEELIIAKEKAENLDRLKSAFLANMSHEIRTPLNAIVGFSELMVYSEDPAEKEEYMSIIQSNNELLLRLINDILDLSKIESGILDRKRETFNLAKVCNELYTMIQPKITNPDVEFQMDNSSPDCWIFLDRSRLKQVWMNYLTNAVKCTKSGYIKMGYSIEREGIRIYVEDSGVGIPEELQERVFGRFQKLNEFAQGTGLGLAISRAIIEGAGGEVGFTSTPGIGSTFWAWIPCEISTQEEHTPTISQPLQHQLSLNEIDKKELKILIAEDNDSNYSLVQHILKNYHLTHVQNGAEAVNKVREEEFDLVLMDMKMPVMGGLEATRKIREFNNRIPIIALTANAFDADRISALDAGCNEFLAKPLKKSQLLELFSKKW